MESKQEDLDRNPEEGRITDETTIGKWRLVAKFGRNRIYITPRGVAIKDAKTGRVKFSYPNSDDPTDINL